MFFNYYQFWSKKKKKNLYVERIKLYLHSLMKYSYNDGILLTNKHKENIFEPLGNIRKNEYLFLPAIIRYSWTFGIAYITYFFLIKKKTSSKKFSDSAPEFQCSLFNGEKIIFLITRYEYFTEINKVLANWMYTKDIYKKNMSLHARLISKTFHIRIHKRVKYFFSEISKTCCSFFSGLLEFSTDFNKRWNCFLKAEDIATLWS